MKIKTKLVLLAFLLTSTPVFFAATPSPEEQEAAMLQIVQMLEQNPHIKKKIIADLRKKVAQELANLSDKDLDKQIKQAQPHEIIKHHIDIQRLNSTNLQGYISESTKKLFALPREKKIQLLANMHVDDQVRLMGTVPLAVQYFQEHGTDDITEESNDTDTTPNEEIPGDKEPAKKGPLVPNEHVLILPVKDAEALAKTLEKQFGTAKGFGPAHNMSFPHLNIEAWHKSFSEDERWIKSLRESIEKAKKNQSETAIMGDDFETEIERDCELANISPIMVAMSLHIQKLNGQLPEEAPSIEDVLDQLPNAKQEKERFKKHKESAVGKIAVVYKDLPPNIKQFLTKATPKMSQSPLFGYAKFLAAARRSPTAPATT